MQLNETEQMARSFNKMARESLGDKVGGFVIFNVTDDVNHREFSIEFTAYDYYPIRLNYEKGRFGCSIHYGQRHIGIPSSQEWWDKTDFSIFFEELKQDLELRIPDKFLKSRGWL